MPVFLTRAFEYVLGCNEQVWDKTCQPVWKRNDVVIPVLFVHGGKDLLKLCVNGRVVEHAPVQKGIDMSAVGNEFCWAASHHHTNVFCNEIGWCAPAVKDGDDVGHVAVRTGVVVTEEAHEQ